jgi:hypothetical protein
MRKPSTLASTTFADFLTPRFPGFLILAVFKLFPFYWVLFWFFY